MKTQLPGGGGYLPENFTGRGCDPLFRKLPKFGKIFLEFKGTNLVKCYLKNDPIRVLVKMFFNSPPYYA
jgi:hypothetical protein